MFGVSASVLDSSTPGSNFAASLVQAAIPNKPGEVVWGQSAPPNFANVNATARLSYSQAVNLAQETVFKCYRVAFLDLFTQQPPIVVPGYNGPPLVRRQQLVVQPTQARQVTPDARVVGGINKNSIIGQLGGILPEFYNGWSRDRKAIVVGSVAWQIGSVLWNGQKIDEDPGNINTKQNQRVYVDFQIDEVEQMVVFSDYVYRWATVGSPASCAVEFPFLVLETACLVQDADTSAMSRYQQTISLPGNAPIEWVHVDEIQASILGTYSTELGWGAPTGFKWLDLDDAQAKANVALATNALKYQITGGLTNEYPGIYAVLLDGAIQQVTWSFGARGATTIASLNTEHQTVVWDYPARRRLENLAPDKSAALANIAESMIFRGFLPKPEGMIRLPAAGG